MIRINLLGKKKVARAPFSLDEKLEKIGINYNDLLDMRWGLLRVGVIVAGLYAANYIPGYLHDEKLVKLTADVQKLTAQNTELQKELVSKKDVRKQMEMLNKEEGELQRQLNAVNALQQGRGLAFSTLNDIESQIEKSKKIWLEDIKFDGKKITLNGKAWDYFAINDFVKSITESTRYSNVLFREISSEPSKYQNVYGVSEAATMIKKFNLEFAVKEGEQ